MFKLLMIDFHFSKMYLTQKTLFMLKRHYPSLDTSRFKNYFFIRTYVYFSPKNEDMIST